MIIIITVIIVAFMVDIGKMIKGLVLEGRRAPKKHRSVSILPGHRGSTPQNIPELDRWKISF